MTGDHGELVRVPRIRSSTWTTRYESSAAALRFSGRYALVIDVRRAAAESARDWPYRSMRKGLMSERDLNSHVCDLRVCFSGSG